MRHRQLTLGDIMYEVLADAMRPPHARGSATSKAAGVSVEKDTPRLRGMVLDAVRAAGSYGATCDELEECLHLRHQTCSARVNELARLEHIVDSGGRRLTRSGRAATVWVTP